MNLADLTIVLTWHGERNFLRRRLRETAGLGCRVIVLNDGHPDRDWFERKIAKHPHAEGISALRHDGFGSHRLRDMALDHLIDTPWVLMSDMDCGFRRRFREGLEGLDPASKPRWMAGLTKTVKGYRPFPGDSTGRTKRDVHPNVHLLPSSVRSRYPSELYGQHAGDDDFFASLLEEFGPECGIIEGMDMQRR